MIKRLKKGLLFVRVIIYVFGVYYDFLSRIASARIGALRASPSPSSKLAPGSSSSPEAGSPEPRNIVVVGASFAGYHAARLIATTLPKTTPFTVVVVEPNTHFQFSWVLPRFCVVEGHEHKAFIPYGPYLASAPTGRVRWVRDRVVSVADGKVRLRAGDEAGCKEIPYEYLVVATGSGAGDALPSRVGVEDKRDGCEALKAMQVRIRGAERLIVVGGGAAGVELATDAKEHHPEKKVTLVHSRPGVMHRFGPELQAAALKGLQDLGVEVFLGERLIGHDEETGAVTLSSGKTLSCDFLVSCTGQKPSGGILNSLAPSAISSDGHVKVLSTLQIADDAHPNIYACGDVTDRGNVNPNARQAMTQATVVADNVVLAATGRAPTKHYQPHWADAVIKLTLGLTSSVVHFGDGKTELLLRSKEKDLALMSSGAWRGLSVTPFEDKDYDGKEDK